MYFIDKGSAIPRSASILTNIFSLYFAPGAREENDNDFARCTDANVIFLSYGYV